ncbi:MAG TPA: DeoR/GlpR family DNA-binding transcription regulator [Tessaracoccus flavescens]|uniref:Lactose phosphotransferase system repressor n=1 Tax=Tessaracoccus flavescens TaxID=399497 RepID=A0A921EPV9_9ACTN|nr:DeoR/GlpR family DNA-binding transcription regulator [Tessaracoccus flavescens]
MQRSIRLKTITGAVRRSGRMSVSQLQELTGASAITIRRDLGELAEQGLLQRVHGGADRAVRGARIPFGTRLASDRPTKQALGAVVADLIGDGESIVIDNGTTCLAAAEALAPRPITALPLSLHTALALTGGQAEVILPEGPVERDTLALNSAGVLAAIGQFRADTFIVGACGASLDHGLTSETYADAAVKRAGFASASRTIMVSSGAKLGRSSAFSFAQAEDLSVLVTTSDAPADVVAGLRAAGVEVILVATEV